MTHGLVMATAILVDATIFRMMLAPARGNSSARRTGGSRAGASELYPGYTGTSRTPVSAEQA